MRFASFRTLSYRVTLEVVASCSSQSNMTLLNSESGDQSRFKEKMVLVLKRTFTRIFKLEGKTESLLELYRLFRSSQI